MITHWSCLLIAVGLMAFAGPALARQDTYLPRADIPGEELFNELADDVQKLHKEQLKLLQIVGNMAAKQQQEEELLQQEIQKQQQQNGDDSIGSLLDDLPAENPVKTLNRLTRLQEHPKPISSQKPREEKKSNHYMSLCHFKLCNMGRKRNTRYLSFWN
ncbi:AAEL010529-PA [Aedes aegypti]|uniref:AAEL010529-PA n=2 Tax=Aedes aegypti TaxID=7159 RepID=A0A1S4FQT5_AEDAE|nr:uncharacterized protein LOC5573484 [Aedes aegypti]EAT37495.1 AAEL010529-PA [Aedes aegypti]